MSEWIRLLAAWQNKGLVLSKEMFQPFTHFIPLHILQRKTNMQFVLRKTYNVFFIISFKTIEYPAGFGLVPYRHIEYIQYLTFAVVA